MHARPVSRDLDEQTELGDVYLEGLMDKQEHITVMKNDQSDIERFVLSVSRAAKQGAI